MQKALSIFLLSALLAPYFVRIGVLIDFKLNQDYIAEFLCVNRNEPIPVCNGTCVLSEKLRKTEEPDEQELPPPILQKTEVIYLPCQVVTLEERTFKRAEKPGIRELPLHYNFSVHQRLFRPPRLV